MQVICVNATNTGYLTQGKTYEVAEEHSTRFTVINDGNKRFSYNKKCFEIEVPTIVFYASGYLMESKAGFNFYKFSDLSSLGAGNNNYKQILAKFKGWLIHEDL